LFSLSSGKDKQGKTNPVNPACPVKFFEENKLVRLNFYPVKPFCIFIYPGHANDSKVYPVKPIFSV